MAARKHVDDVKSAQLERRAAELRAARDFRNWSDWLQSSAAEGAPVREQLLAAHRAAVRCYLGADGPDNVAFCAWEIVRRLDDALVHKGLGSKPEVIGKTIWRGMRESATDISKIPLEDWLVAVAEWRGRKTERTAKKGRAKEGAYDYRAIVHRLLNFVIEGRTTTRASAFRQLDRMAWNEHAPYVATTFRAFKEPRIRGPNRKKS